MKYTISTLAAIMIAGSAYAVPVTQNLNGFATNTAINSLDFGFTTATVTTVSNRAPGNGGTNQAVTFDSDNPTGNDDDLGPFNPGLGQILIISGPDNGQGLPDDDAQGGTITFDFDQSINFLSFDFIDTESGINELFVSADNGFTSSALTIGDGLFDTFIAGGALDGITSITFTFEGSGAVDNFSVEPIPLPAPILMLLAGIGGLGVVRARRRTAA